MPSWNDMEFTRKQMMVIAIGLEEGMNITPYAKPELTANEMEDLYRKLRTNGGLFNE